MDPEVSKLEDLIYNARHDYFESKVIDTNEYFDKIHILRKQYFNLTGKEFIPALITD